MHKKLSIFLLSILILGLVGCGGGSSNGPKPGKWGSMEWGKDRWQ